MNTLENIDRSIFFVINSNYNSILDIIMWQVSHQFIWTPLYAFFLFYAYNKLSKKRLFYFLLSVGLCFLLADQISVHAFKEVFQRYRPSHNLEIKHLVHSYTKSNGEIYYGGLYGFISSHAANFFALSTFLYLTFRHFSKYWILLFLWALIIIYSRVYLGVHYPSDVFAGAILGSIIGWTVYKLYNVLNKSNE